MKTSKPDLNDFFHEARQVPPVLSNDEARNIINNLANSKADLNKQNNNTNKGFRKMSIIYAGLVTTAAIGIVSLNTFFNNNETQIKNNSKSDNVSKYKTNDEKLFAVNRVTDEQSNKPTADKQDNKEANNVLNVKKVQGFELYSDTESASSKQVMNMIKGVQLIELDQNEAERLGLTITKGDDPKVIFRENRMKPMLCTLFVKGGFTFVLDEESNPNINQFPSPRMITDNAGNRRMSVFNDDDSKLVETDHTTINLDEFSNKKKKIDKKMVFINQRFEFDDSTKPNKYFSDLMSVKSLNLDSALKKMNISNLNADSLLKVAMKNIQFSSGNNLNGNIKFDTAGANVLFKNFKFDTTANGNFFKFFNTDPENEQEIEINLDDEDVNPDNADQMQQDVQIEVRMQDFNQQTANVLTNSNSKMINGSNLQLDSLSKTLKIEIKSDSMNKADYNVLNNRKAVIIPDSIIKVCNPKILILDDENGNSIDMKKKALNKSFNFSKKIKKLNDEMDKYIRINKLIPVVIPMGKNPDKNEMNSNEDFSFIFWYDPTPELISVLPSSYKNKIEAELKVLDNSPEICNTAIKGDEAVLDIWRACSGAVENLHTFPNPAKDKINLKYNLTSERSISISINDLSGRKIADLVSNENKQAGSYEEQFPLKSINPGMYLISIKTNKNEQAVQRIIVE